MTKDTVRSCGASSLQAQIRGPEPAWMKIVVGVELLTETDTGVTDRASMRKSKLAAEISPNRGKTLDRGTEQLPLQGFSCTRKGHP